MDMCVAMDTAAHDTSSSDLDESVLEHVFVCCMKGNTCKIMSGIDNVFRICFFVFLRICMKNGFLSFLRDVEEWYLKA